MQLKNLAPFALCFSIVLGCSPSKDLETSNATGGTPVPPAAVPTAVSQTPAPTAPADADDNPNRAFQLRELQHATLKVSGRKVDAWVMDSDAKRQEGMMFLTDKDVRDDQGMLFVFRDLQQNDGKHGFWMHNTILPLDIVYISADHRVLNIQKGKPHDDTSLPPSGAYLSVLELKQGEAAKIGMKPGTVVTLPGGVSPKD